MLHNTTQPEVTLTIRQMAAQSGLSEYTLRYYKKVGLIKPIPRDRSSGHRRYSLATVEMVEELSYLRASGLSLNDMRTFLRLREHGNEAAAELKALFLTHAEVVENEIHTLKIRQQFLSGKVAYWDARINGDMEQPPLRLFFGKGAHKMIHAEYDKRLGEWDKFKGLSEEAHGE